MLLNSKLGRRRFGNMNGMGKISVIIPALDESERIAAVVAFAKRNRMVDEVLVIDDGSIDGTPEIAQRAGARVIMSRLLGKGASMEDGMREARNEILLYLDGDLAGLAENLVERMTAPLALDEADFVKARFTRAGGRVTVLTARPLIRTYFPELATFEQPLSGVMAARKSLLETLRFEDDFGVDAGLLIDAAGQKARFAEVDIGHLEHDSKPLEALEEMATQVARTILNRAALWGRLRPAYVQDVIENERHRHAEMTQFFSRIPSGEKLALFDMDGTLLKGRFIVDLARHCNKEMELGQFLDNFELSPEERTRQIGGIFAGVARETFEQTAREMPLQPGAIETIVGLRKRGYRVGIITDSFQIAAEIVRRRVFADFALANMMRFRRGKASGTITLCPAMAHPQGCAEHALCKSNAIKHLIEKLGIDPANILAAGDGLNDLCMLREAGKSFAFQPKSLKLSSVAEVTLNGNLADLLEFC